jgi:hypothetical protein
MKSIKNFFAIVAEIIIETRKAKAEAHARRYS